MNQNFDLALLRSFAAVADQKSMTAACRVLHVTQGAISQQITRLEALVGDTLLLREARGLRLTPAGERLLSRARGLLALNDAVWAELRGGVAAGAVRLGLPYDLVETFAPAIKQFCEGFPQVELALVCAPSPALLAQVGDGQLDVAVAEEPAGSETGEVLAIDRLVWVGARGGRAPSLTPLPLSLVAESCAFRPAVVAALNRQGRASRAVFENGGLDVARVTVRMDLAVSAWLVSTVPADLAILTAESGLPELPPFAITLHMAARGAAITELTRCLRDAMTRPG